MQGPRYPYDSNRVDLGVRVELPAEIFSDLTDELYESKIVYRTEKYEDYVRTFCMNPKGAVVNENTNGIVTVNGHSYEDPAKQTHNTNFALLVAKHFSEPFKIPMNMERVLQNSATCWRWCNCAAFWRPDPRKKKHAAANQ